MTFFTFLLIGLGIFTLITIVAGLRIVGPFEKGLIVRLGKYLRTAGPGLSVIIPYIDQMIKVNMREQVIAVVPQQVITKDNVLVTVDAVIYYKIEDPFKAEFAIENFNIAATTLAQTNLRNLIGEKMLDETLTARDHINTSLRQVLDEATQPWGVKVTKVELQQIEPPKDITDAMGKQMKAEREKRARILEAQGIRESDILQAEGQAQATLLKAEAQAQAVTKLATAAEKNFTARAQELKRLEVAEKVLSGDSTKFVLPTSGSLVNVLNLEGTSKVIPIKQR